MSVARQRGLCSVFCARASGWLRSRIEGETALKGRSRDGPLAISPIDRPIGNRKGHRPGSVNPTRLRPARPRASSSFIQPIQQPSSYVSLFSIAPIQCPLTLASSVTPSSSPSRLPFPFQSHLTPNTPTVPTSSASAQKNSKAPCRPLASYPGLGPQCLTSTPTLPPSPAPNLILRYPPRMIQVSSHRPTNMTTEMKLVTFSLPRVQKQTRRFVEEAVKVRHDCLPPFLLIALTMVFEPSLRSVS